LKSTNDRKIKNQHAGVRREIKEANMYVCVREKKNTTRSV